MIDVEEDRGYLEAWEGHDLRDREVKPALPGCLAHPEEHAWVWLNPVEVGDAGYPAGFPSSCNADLQRNGGRWVLTRGFYVRDWVEANCVLSDGRWIGQPFLLQQWQLRLVVELFEVRPDTGLRRYRWSLVGLPKKNGKTELAAALGLFMLHGDHEPAPLVIAAAASDDQADLVFGAANTMATMSATLKQALAPQATRITVPDSPRARMQRVAAATGTNDGKQIHCVICDELHEWKPGKGEQVWNVLTNGLGARDQPLVIQITTAGHDVEGTVCGRQYAQGCAVREGTAVDPTYYFLWFEAAEGLDYTTEAYIASCNPSYGVTVQWPFFKDQLSKKTEATYRRYFGNEWTEAEEIWELAQLWDALAGDFELDEGRPAYVGIDIGLKHDSAALVVAQWQDELQRPPGEDGEDRGRGQVVLEEWIWENPYPPADRRHAVWRFNIALVEDLCRQLRERFPASAREDEDEDPVPGPAFFYDPMFFERSAELLRDDERRLHMIDYPQSEVRMVDASQSFFELGKQGKLRHRGRPAFKRHVRGVIAKETGRGWRISKPKGSRKHIDAAVAAAIAAREATRDLYVDEAAFSIW